MKTYPTKSRIQEQKKRINDIGSKGRRFGEVRFDSELAEKVLRVKMGGKA